MLRPMRRVHSGGPGAREKTLTMTVHNSTGSPIYDGLVEVRGDVTAAARQAAAEAHRIADQTLRISAGARQPGPGWYPEPAR